MEQALINAARNNQLSVIKMLTQRQLNLDYKDNLGKTALVYSALCGNLDAVKHLIEAGSNVNQIDDFSNTILHHAVVSKNREVAKYLLTCDDVNIDQKNMDGNTPLIMAVATFDKDMVELLLKHGAKDLANRKNKTALDLASEKGAAAIVELILMINSENIPPKIKNKEEKKPLQKFSCEQCGNNDLDLELIDKGVVICQACGTYYLKDGSQTISADVERAVQNALMKNGKEKIPKKRFWQRG
ncbi:MAG: ankyrin repeat domain-containing protein [Firmicutes bacterium]|nr:ankyrin repeat domain-containing protein [Bacillota bacterium]